MIIHRPGQKIHFVPGIGINVITPQSAAAAGWWLSGGIPAANCVAAYQAKGAASYADSLIDLSGHGKTATLLYGVPNWNSSAGWEFNADWSLASSSLGDVKSIACVFTDSVFNNTWSPITESINSQNMLRICKSSKGGANPDPMWAIGGTPNSIYDTYIQSGVIIITNTNFYFNGTSLLTKSAGSTFSGNWGIAQNYAGGNNALWRGKLQAISYYDIDLDAYAGALATAMADL